MAYTIKADLKENRLYVTVEGSFTLNDVKPYKEKLLTEAGKLKRGWTSLQDLRQNVMDPSVATELEDVKVKVEQMGLSKCAIVVSSVVLKGQVKRSFNKPSANSVEDKFFNKMDEAIAFLNS